MPLAVIAIGGNSLTREGQVGTIAEQFENARETSRGVVDLIEAGWKVVLTHGNGPQVGNMLRRVELSRHEVYPLPLGICVADSQGGIGYMLKQVLYNALRDRRLPGKVVTMITQVVVDPHDPAFTNPTKPIGGFMSAEEAEKRKAEGWTVREDAGRGFRQVVASPKPVEIVEIEAIQNSVNAGFITIAVGGGGVPVVRQGHHLEGVDVVIDKDRASRVLATMLQADLFLISTGVSAVQINFGTPQAETLKSVRAADLERYLREGQFPAGSMGPKIEAAIEYVRTVPGGRAVITDPAHLVAAAQGHAGTQIDEGYVA